MTRLRFWVLGDWLADTEKVLFATRTRKEVFYEAQPQERSATRGGEDNEQKKTLR